MNASSIFKKSRTNFALAFWGLPKDQRRAMEAIYAYCRIVDDIVDETSSVEQAQRELGHWKSALANWPEFSAVLPIEVASELEWTVKHFPVQKSDLLWIMEGVEKDLHPIRYRTLEELLVYCDGVASAVGFCCMAIFGVQRDVAQNYVFATGRALQLTNILRDIASDAQRGRLYIPKSFLEGSRVSEDAIFSSVYDENYLSMIRSFSDKIIEFYSTSEREMKNLPLNKIWPAEVMKKTYFAIFKKIAEKKFNVFDEKIKVGTLKKAWIALSQPRT